jgi:hypothetical protein
MLQPVVKTYYTKKINGTFRVMKINEEGKEVKAFPTNYHHYNSAWQQANRMNKREVRNA